MKQSALGFRYANGEPSTKASLPEYSDDDDAFANLVERRFFAADSAVKLAQADCDVLRNAMELVRAEWRRASVRVAELERLRDGLGKRALHG